MQPAPLPENVASSFCGATESLLSAKYVPVLYCGEQLLHGMNYMIIYEQTLAAQNVSKN